MVRPLVRIYSIYNTDYRTVLYCTICLTLRDCREPKKEFEEFQECAYLEIDFTTDICN
jgi:hypothetical protein